MLRTTPYRTSGLLARTAPTRTAPRLSSAIGGVDVDAFAHMRDAFAGSTLHPRWSVYKPASLASSTVSGGRVRLVPVRGGSDPTGGFWYSASNGAIGSQQNDGFLVNQAVGPAAGTPVGFDARARVRVLATNGSSQVPETVGEWRFGGLALHHPTRSSYFRYLHVALGSEGGAGVSGLECKVNRVNATGGASVFPVANIVGNLERDLRIVRRTTDTDLIDIYDRATAGALSDSSGWTRRYTVRWSDGADGDDDFDVCPQETDAVMPDDVQIGLMCYSNATAHDILLDVFEFWIGETAA
jgi:hypothetical protein